VRGSHVPITVTTCVGTVPQRYPYPYAATRHRQAGSGDTFQSLALSISHPSLSKTDDKSEERLFAGAAAGLFVFFRTMLGRLLLPRPSVFHDLAQILPFANQDQNRWGKESCYANGNQPGRLLRFREGQMSLSTPERDGSRSTSNHWHGSCFRGIGWRSGVVLQDTAPNLTSTDSKLGRVHLLYHSHTGPQEQIGLYGPLIIDPIQPEPYEYDRDYVVLLSDWTFEDPVRVMDRLKNQPTYYNFQQRTAVDFFREVKTQGWRATLADRLMWGRMRMSATDRLDVTGYRYTYLINGSPLT